jgi:hypothetical protein
VTTIIVLFSARIWIRDLGDRYNDDDIALAFRYMLQFGDDSNGHDADSTRFRLCSFFDSGQSQEYDA